MGAIEAPVSQPELFEDFRLMLETLSRFLVHGVLEELLSGRNIVREDAASKGKSPKVFA